MMKCVLLIALLAAAVQASPFASKPALVHNIPTLPPIPGAPVYPSPRIVNGQRASRGQFPHQAAVSIDNAAFCGGSLISPEWVLTAGHCAYNARSWTVTLGQQQQSANEEGRETLTTTNGIVHENYDPTYLNNDVALLKLPRAVELSQWIQPVALPSRSDVGNDFNGAAVTASGWGKDSDASNSVSDQLNFVNLHVISNDECAQTYGSATINGGKLCCGAPGGISTCNGDSGGPLINDGKKLVGVTSFVSSAGCASGAPSGFSRVTPQLDWISGNTGIQIAS